MEVSVTRHGLLAVRARGAQEGTFISTGSAFDMTCLTTAMFLFSHSPKEKVRKTLYFLSEMKISATRHTFARGATARGSRGHVRIN